jgi:hypothetical protein
MGRGLDLQDFERLKGHGDSVRGIYHQRIPITGRLVSGVDRFEYNFSYKLDGTETARSHWVKLQSFPGGGFVPSRLTTWVVHLGVTNLESDYEIMSVRESPAAPSLSPFALYPLARRLEQAGDRLFAADSGRKIELKRSPTEPLRSYKALFVAIIILLSVLVFLLRFFLRPREGEFKENKQM